MAPLQEPFIYFLNRNDMSGYYLMPRISEVG